MHVAENLTDSADSRVSTLLADSSALQCAADSVPNRSPFRLPAWSGADGILGVVLHRVRTLLLSQPFVIRAPISTNTTMTHREYTVSVGRIHSDHSSALPAVRGFVKKADFTGKNRN